MTLGLAFLLSAGAVLFAREPAADAADPVLDFAFFREKIEPVVQGVCAQCHAGKGKGRFGLVVHAVGAPFPDVDHRTNFAIVSALVVPGKPDKSPFLAKPLAVRDGGVKHEGGDRILKGTPAYKAWVDFINGERGAGSSAPPKGAPASVPGQPDFGYFYANVEPVLFGTCARCHAGAGKGRFGLVIHEGGTRFPLADHRKNFETISRLLVAGKPEQSLFLLKPLAERDGGKKHGGGDLFAKGDANHTTWSAFIRGEAGPTPPEDPPPEEVLPSADAKGLLLQAENLTANGDVVTTPREGATIVAPGPGGGRLTGRFRASRAGEYLVTFRAFPASRGLRLRLDGGEPLDVDVVAPAGVDGAGAARAWVDVSPRIPLDGGKPLDARLGRLTVVGTRLEMDGREGTARFLAPVDVAHRSIEATVAIPGPDEPGRDDAWLLFDCIDAENGKLFGLIDGARKLAMGVLEGGRPRIIATAPLPEGTVLDAEHPARLGVLLLDGLAVGRFAGKAALKVNFDRGLGAARFGIETHGLATVLDAAIKGFEGQDVHRMALSVGGVVHLRRGDHTIDVELLPAGAAVDSVQIKDLSE